MMKKATLLLWAVLCAITIFAQNSGKGFSYQAVARDAQGDMLTSHNIQVRFSLMPGQQAITPAWQETHVATTDAFGTFALTIGKGIKTAGSAATFSDINFANALYWLRVEIKDSSNFKEVSYTALSSVPYAEVAGNAQACPPGMVMPFAGDTAKIPSGWMLCDGRELDRTKYAALYNVMGTAWGQGNNSSTFNIPDLRGLFLRGVDYTAGKDPDKNSRLAIKTGGNTNNNVGSYQDNYLASHKHIGKTQGEGGEVGGEHQHSYIKHPYNIPLVWEHPNNASDDDGYNTRIIDAAEDHGNTGNIFVGSEGSAHNHPISIDNTGGNETRPRNAYVNYIIKY